MSTVSKQILSTSIPIIGVLLIASAYIYKDTNDFGNNDIYEGVGKDDESGVFSEVIIPLSCTYPGKIKLDTESQNSLKRFQRSSLRPLHESDDK